MSTAVHITTTLIIIVNAAATLFVAFTLHSIFQNHPNRWGTWDAAAASAYAATSLVWLTIRTWVATPIFPTY